MPIDRRSVEIALEQIRFSFNMEGGDIHLLDVHDDGTVEVRLSGACHGCAMSLSHIKMGVENYLRQLVPEVRQVVAVEM